jgi:uncharacterized protein involved in oxidation of intracellular sulfur
MHYLFIINDGPYGNERPYNALRLALNLVKRQEAEIRVFLMGDGVQCAVTRQTTPEGYYNIERMIKSIARRGEVATWGTCAQARGLEPGVYIEGVKAGNMELLGDWSVDAEHILVF